MHRVELMLLRLFPGKPWMAGFWPWSSCSYCDRKL